MISPALSAESSHNYETPGVIFNDPALGPWAVQDAALGLPRGMGVWNPFGCC